ncbi:MAG: helix-turn-helix domain-containing protein [Chloroflexota bacterium]|nr:helix-turn-helix domain-containing protein [Chloroflexota bacterium]
MSGARLSYLRRQHGLTQAQLAAKAQLTQQAICLLERGQRRPLLVTCQRLARALEVSLDDLLVPDPPLAPPHV